MVCIRWYDGPGSPNVTTPDKTHCNMLFNTYLHSVRHGKDAIGNSISPVHVRTQLNAEHPCNFDPELFVQRV